MSDLSIVPHCAATPKSVSSLAIYLLVIIDTAHGGRKPIQTPEKPSQFTAPVSGTIKYNLY